MPGPLIGIANSFVRGRQECEQAIADLGDGHVNAKTIHRLQQQLGRDLATVVVTSARLQPAASKKLGSPADSCNPRFWWVTDKSLQQASTWQVARLKARWFGDRLVHDLCCGIGGDAHQLARRGPVLAVDSDPLIAAMAAANLAHHHHTPGSDRVRCADATTIEIPPRSGLHVDPDRRPGDARRTCPDQYQPALRDVIRLAERSSATVVKLAPAARIDVADLRHWHRCWISLARTVREQSLLMAEAVDLAGCTAGANSAAILTSDGTTCWFAPPAEEITKKADVASQPMSIMVDPDAAIRAAGLTEAFANMHGLHVLGSASGFLTGPPERLTPALAGLSVAGRVIWSGSCDDRKLRRELRGRDAYPVTVKVRGTDHDPAAITRRYRDCGGRGVTLWLGRAGDRARAVITQ